MYWKSNAHAPRHTYSSETKPQKFPNKEVYAQYQLSSTIHEYLQHPVVGTHVVQSEPVHPDRQLNKQKQQTKQQNNKQTNKQTKKRCITTKYYQIKITADWGYSFAETNTDVTETGLLGQICSGQHSHALSRTVAVASDWTTASATNSCRRGGRWSGG